MADFSLADLERIIRERARSGDPDSWTAKLFASGMEKAAKKLGEEAVETVISAVGGDRDGLHGRVGKLGHALQGVLGRHAFGQVYEVGPGLLVRRLEVELAPQRLPVPVVGHEVGVHANLFQPEAGQAVERAFEVHAFGCHLRLFIYLPLK